ncbi:MAG: chitobiase/beta-hexosaminidase C-terminal domain-containing protein [Spirochaetales bacterium]|nr:chitobiase/beta-hexosaminidase C-terminal domain-containing protein [Spirochaetales bacterium]
MRKKTPILLLLTFSITLLIISCENFSFPGFDFSTKSGTKIELVIPSFKTDSSGYPSFPFIHSDSDHALVQILSVEDDRNSIVAEQSVDISDDADSVTLTFDDLTPGNYQIWTTTYNTTADEIRSFGLNYADITEGSVTQYAKLGPAIKSFTATGSSGTGDTGPIQAEIEGSTITISMPGEEFSVIEWKAMSSRGADSNIWVYAQVYPEGGGSIPADGTNGFSMVDDSTNISMTDASTFFSGLGTTDEFYLSVQALNSDSVRKVIGQIEYKVEFTYPGEVVLERLAPPVLTPSGGVYEEGVEVSITSDVEGVSIWYTTDGTNPGADRGSEYTAPFIINDTNLIMAVAVKSGMKDSVIVRENYTFHIEEVEAPVFSLAGGYYEGVEYVGITTDTEGAAIWYTIDGSEPSASNGTEYSAEIRIDENLSLRAIALKEGMYDSEISEVVYEINLPDVPSPSFHNSGEYYAGKYIDEVQVTMDVSDLGEEIPDAEIWYTLDGTEPARDSGTLYDGTLVLNGDTTLKAIAFYPDMDPSSIKVKEYIIIGRSAAPDFSDETGTYTGSLAVTLFHPNSAAKIYYEINGVPDQDSTFYTVGNPVELLESTGNQVIELSAFTYEEGSAPSVIVSKTYTLLKTPPNNVILVDGSASATGDGRGWESAMNNLQDAMDLVVSDGSYNEVWVKEGVYVPDSNPHGTVDDPRDAHFTLWDNTSILGGFAGNEWLSSQRTPNMHETILSGDLNGDDTANSYGSAYELFNNGENLYNVFNLNNMTPLTNAHLDGFIITGGNADGDVSKVGGGMNIPNTNVTVGLIVSNCVFLMNQAKETGGGVYMGVDTRVQFYNVIFAGNVSLMDGGGIFLQSDTASADFMNTVFFGNFSASQGGGIFWQGATGKLNNSVFIANHSDGGGNAGGSNVGTQAILNIIAWGNTGSPTDFVNGGPMLAIDNSIIQNVGSYSGDNNYDSSFDPLPDPKFLNYENPQGADGLWFTEDDGYLIQSGSWARDRGAAPTIPDTFDVDGDSNISESYPYDILYVSREAGAIDMGVHELP